MTVRKQKSDEPMELPPAFGFRTRRFSSLSFEPRGKLDRRLLPAFGPSWGTGYSSSVFRLPHSPVRR